MLGFLLSCFLEGNQGRAIAQVVSRWLPTAAARVQTRVYSCGICVWQNGAGSGFLWVLRFPLPIFIPPISPQSPSPIIRGWYNRSAVAAVPKVPAHKLKKKIEWNRESSVFMAMVFRLDGPGSIFGGAIFFSCPQRTDRLWGPPNLLSNKYQGLFPRE
jgi:hypothetical protein